MSNHDSIMYWPLEEGIRVVWTVSIWAVRQTIPEYKISGRDEAYPRDPQ